MFQSVMNQYYSAYYVAINKYNCHNLINGWTTASKMLQNHAAYCLLRAAFLLGLLIDPEDGSSRFFRNIDELMLDYME
jgi:hypothetical protein